MLIGRVSLDPVTGKLETDADAIRERVEFVFAENKRMKEAIRWALGISGDFKPRPEGGPNYWWRKELAERAGFHLSPGRLEKMKEE